MNCRCVTIARRAVLALVVLLCALTGQAQKRLFVFSDPHLLASELFDPNSSAFQNELAEVNKMFDLTNEIMEAMISKVLESPPDAVLISGDLTKQGSRVSHEAMAGYLKQITDAGIPVYVVPGNHDVNNSQAARYDGANKRAVPSVTSSEFAELYSGMGYSQAIARDSNSLSYVAELVPGLRLIAIDDCQSVRRDTNPSLSNNGLTTDTQNWIYAQIDTARLAGKQVLVMMHHNIMEHIDDQSILTKAALVQQADAVRDSLIAHGAHLVLSGHMHISNISTWYNEALTDSIVEITTGSSITYPCHYRIIDLSPDMSTFSVSTGCITQVEGCPDLVAYGHEREAAGTKTTIKSLVSNNWATFNNKLEEYHELLGDLTFTKEGVTEVAIQDLSESMIELYLVMEEGNEWEKDSQAIRSHLTSAASTFAKDLLADAGTLLRIVAVPIFTAYFNSMMKTPLNSILNDCTFYDTARANVTDDLRPTLCLPAPMIPYDTRDLNTDGHIDVLDVSLLIDIILTNDQTLASPGSTPDVNSDNRVDVSDVSTLIDVLLGKNSTGN